MEKNISIEGYVKHLQSFENTVNYAIDITHEIGGIWAPNHLLQAQRLFTKITTTSISIVHLLPLNSLFPSEKEFWDFASVASLVRNLWENYITFYYIGIDEVTEEERDFRLRLFTYHHNNEKYKLYKSLGVTPEELLEFEKNIPKAREVLKNHPVINTLTLKNRQQVLSGAKAMYLKRDEILEKIPLDTSDIKSLYRLLSNHIHSTPLSFANFSNERGRGGRNEVEVGYSTFMLMISTKYLSAAITDLIYVFTPFLNKFDWDKFNTFKVNASAIIENVV